VSPVARFAHLWYQLFLRDLRARYSQTALGLLWGLGRPLLELAVYTVVFGAVLNVPTDGVPYPLFAYTGIVLWTFVSGAIPRATTSITASAPLVASIPFPRATIPMAAVGLAAFDAMVSASLLVIALWFFEATPGIQVIWVIPIMGILAIFVSALSLIFATLNVFYHDFTHLIALAIRVWMFLTPVAYATSAVPERYQQLYRLNPLVAVFESVRGIMVRGLAPDWSSLIYPAMLSVMLLAVAVISFRRLEPHFAETV
jgi:lipopolysaccharide transport system permease protein